VTVPVVPILADITGPTKDLILVFVRKAGHAQFGIQARSTLIFTEQQSTMLAAVIANIIVFHLTMAPLGLPVAAVVAALWAIVATRYRSSFAPLFVRKPASELDRPAQSTPETTPALRACA